MKMENFLRMMYYILDGILQDVIRHKFKTAIESIKETIERKELCD